MSSTISGCHANDISVSGVKGQQDIWLINLVAAPEFGVEVLQSKWGLHTAPDGVVDECGASG